MYSATKALGEFIAGATYESLPAAVSLEAKRRIADVISTGLSGYRAGATGIRNFTKEFGRQGAATIWGSGEKCSSAYAALANGTMSFHLELDDVHRTSHTHPGVSTVPAAFALCEEYGLSGKDLILSVVLGYESTIRVGLAVSPSIYVDRTYLAPGTLSPFGAVACAAKLKGLDAQKTADALGAVSYFGPTACYESFKLGAGIKDMIMGWGNFCGIYGAEMARMGFGGPASALEGDFGFCKTTSAHFDMTRFYQGMGTEYEILNTGVKPYACCRQHHAAIDCMLELRQRYGFTLEDVEHVLVRTFTVSSRGNKKLPASVPEAKYSIPYILAVALRDGAAWRSQFTETLIRDPDLLAFAAKVDVVPDAELDLLYDEKWPSIVEVTLRDGRTVSCRHDLPKGEPEFPCTEEELKDKFISLACDTLSPQRAEVLWDKLQHLETIENVRDLAELLVSDM